MTEFFERFFHTIEEAIFEGEPEVAFASETPRASFIVGQR